MKKNHPKAVLMLLSAMSFLTSGDIYASAPLLVSISHDLNIGIPSAALSVTAYMGAFALFNLFFGPLGDRFGRTRIVIVCSFGTSVFSCLCLFADSLWSLVVFRAFNGLFAAGIMPVSVAIIGEMFEESRRQKAIATMIGVMVLGGASAAFIGGALSFFLSWKSVYVIYGLAELGISFILMFMLERQPPGRPEPDPVHPVPGSAEKPVYPLLLFFGGNGRYYCGRGILLYRGAHERGDKPESP